MPRQNNQASSSWKSLKQMQWNPPPPNSQLLKEGSRQVSRVIRQRQEVRLLQATLWEGCHQPQVYSLMSKNASIPPSPTNTERVCVRARSVGGPVPGSEEGTAQPHPHPHGAQNLVGKQ